MRPLETKLRNFLSYKNATLKLDNRGLVCIRADNQDELLADDNGGGKTALLEAIVWCCWGVTIRGLKGDEVVNDTVGKDCMVSFKVQDGETIYTIIRTRLAKGKKPNDLVLLVNGKDASQHKVSTQEKINQLLGMDFETFCAMMPGSRTKVAELTDAKIKELLEGILGSQSYALAHELAKKRLKPLVLQVTSLETQVEHLSKLYAEIEAEMAAVEVKNLEFSQKQEDKLLLLSKKIKELTATVKEKQSFLSNKQSVEAAKAAAHEARDVAAENVRGSDTRRAEFQEGVQSALDTANNTIGGIKAKLKIVNKRLMDIETLEANCERCNQTVDEKHKHQLKEDLLLDQRVLGAQHTKYVNLIADFRASLAARMAEFDEERRELLLQYEQKAQELHDLHLILSGEMQATREALQQANFWLEDTQHRYNEACIEANPYEDLIDTMSHKAIDVMLELETTREDLKRFSSRMKYLEYWVEGFSTQGIRSFLLENITPFLNERVAYYADLISSGGLKIEFHTQSLLKSGTIKENFYIDVKLKHGGKSYKAASDGEKRKASIAISLALGDLAALQAKKTWTMRFLDEPFESLDETSIQSVAKLLQEQSSKYETVFVVTHNNQLKSMFPKEILVTKKDGVSTLNE